MSYSENTAKNYGIKAFYDLQRINAVRKSMTGDEKIPLPKIQNLADLIAEGTGQYGCLSPKEEKAIIEHLEKRGFYDDDLTYAFKGIREHLDAFEMC